MTIVDPQASATGRLKRLTVEGFRGFRDRATLDLDASAVLMTGPNGTGKTSVFDALLWIFVGDVARLSEFKLRRNEEYLRNEYVGVTRQARVELEFSVSGQSAIARRVGTSAGSVLSLIVGADTFSGQDAERRMEGLLVRGELPLREFIATSGLLQQDDLRLLLRTKPDERYRQLLRLLGLQAIEQFGRHAASDLKAKRLATRNARDVVYRWRSEVQRLGEQLETARLQAAAADDEVALVPDALDTTVSTYSEVLELTSEPSTAEALSALAGSTRNLASQFRSLYDQLDALPEALPPSNAGELTQLTEDLARSRVDLQPLQRIQTQADEASRLAAVTQDALNRLAAAALPLLDNAVENAPCPVCGSIIDPQHVAQELSARAASGAAHAAAEAVARSAGEDVRRAEVRIEELNRLSARLQAQETERRAVVTTFRRLIEGVASLQQQAAASGLQLTASPAFSQLIIGADGSESEVGSSDGDDLLFQAWSVSRGDFLEYLTSLTGALRSVAGAAETASAARTSVRAAAERSAAVPRLQARWDEQNTRLEQVEQEYDAARQAETAATTLAQSTTRAAEELFRERFAALEPLVNDIYARLDPHPSFTRLDFRVETYRSKSTAIATVLDVIEDITANPMIVFSSAQANAVVLSAFLALGWASGDRGLPFVLLDDPLQALDDVNVLGFADLARRLRRQRQLVLATHEQRFADLLERKLTGRADGEDLIVHRFLGWSRSGPTIETRRVSPRSDLGLRVLSAS